MQLSPPPPQLWQVIIFATRIFAWMEPFWVASGPSRISPKVGRGTSQVTHHRIKTHISTGYHSDLLLLQTASQGFHSYDTACHCQNGSCSYLGKTNRDIYLLSWKLPIQLSDETYTCVYTHTNTQLFWI